MKLFVAYKFRLRHPDAMLDDGVLIFY